jgi:hypothetical protein
VVGPGVVQYQRVAGGGDWLEPGEAKVDKLRGDSGTVMTIKKIDFDIPIPDEMFSERELLKK